jgi:hypothetical protein
MPVQDHPRYDEWLRLLDALKAANDRFRQARDQASADADAAQQDLHEAQRAYDALCDEIGV